MDFTIYHAGRPVDHITATSLQSAQRHADKFSAHPVVAVHTFGTPQEMADARLKSRLMAMTVADRIEYISLNAAVSVFRLPAMQTGDAEAVASSAQKEIARAIGQALDASNSHAIAALRQIETGGKFDPRDVAGRALAAAGTR